MKPITSILLTSSFVCAVCEYTRIMNAKIRLASKDYREITIKSSDIIDRKKVYAHPFTIHNATKFDDYEWKAFDFGDFIIAACTQNELKDIYNYKIIKRYVPSSSKDW